VDAGSQAATARRRRACYKVAVPRELSAGGVVVRRMRGRWWLAAIRPQGKPPGVWALPKGLIDPGEDAKATAEREVLEETGLRGEAVSRLGDVRYVYSRGGTRIFKVVVFYLVRTRGGRIGAIAPAMRREVADARWLPLDDAPRLLAYGGERDMAERARAALAPLRL
jgi:8-oxo-dGTP pyrophosphatase MutT (NUDIX family)